MVIVGFDYGVYRHSVCAIDEDGQVVLAQEVEHSSSALLKLLSALQRVVPGSEVRVGIERSSGVLVDMLAEFGFRVFAINPKQIDRWRQFGQGSVAKDDGRDALAIANALRLRPEAFKEVEDSPARAQVRQLIGMRDAIVRGRTEWLHRLVAALRPAMPTVLDLVDPQTEWGLAVLIRIAQVSRPTRLRASTLSKLMVRVRKVTPEDVVAALRADQASMSTRSWDGIATVAGFAAKQLVQLNRQHKAIKRTMLAAIDRFVAEAGPEAQRDIEIIQSMPGAGPHLVAALIAYGWGAVEDRDRQRVRRLGGVAPVTQQTGGRRRPRQSEVRQRRACQSRLREALHHWGRVATMYDAKAKARFAELKARGFTFGRSIRQLVDGLLIVLFSALKKGEVYVQPVAVAC